MENDRERERKWSLPYRAKTTAQQITTKVHTRDVRVRSERRQLYTCTHEHRIAAAMFTSTCFLVGSWPQYNYKHLSDYVDCQWCVLSRSIARLALVFTFPSDVEQKHLGGRCNRHVHVWQLQVRADLVTFIRAM
jgi:hypothetical protein